MDVDAWDPWTPAQLAERLGNVPGAWAVAGGWAIDLFAGGEPREHHDLDVVTSRCGLAMFEAALPELEWFAAHGKLTPVARTPGVLSETWQTWGWDTSAEAWRLDVMREPWDGDRWGYRRNPTIGRRLTAAIRISASGIPYLAPEIVLLFKAKRNRAHDQRDLCTALPLMSSQQVTWLAAVLEAEHPGHPWLGDLRP